MRRLPANDLCILGARDCNSAVHEAVVQRDSLHVSQKGAVRLRYQLVSLSTNSLNFKSYYTYGTKWRAHAPVGSLQL